MQQTGTWLRYGGRMLAGMGHFYFAEPGDATLLGARTLEGFNYNVDPVAKRLVPGGPVLAPANIVIGRAS